MFAWAGSDRYTSYLVFPGAILQAFACFITITTCTHLGALAGRYTSTFQALCTGGANSSVVVYLIVKLLHGEGVSRNITLTVVAGIWIIILLYTYFLFPHYKITDGPSSEGASGYELANETNGLDSPDGITPLSEKFKKDPNQNVLTESVEHNELPADEKQRNESDNSTNKAPTLWQCLKTPPCLLGIIWFALILFIILTILGTYNPWIIQLTEGDDDKDTRFSCPETAVSRLSFALSQYSCLWTVDHLTNALAYCQMSALFISLFPGMLTDFFRRKMTDRGDMTQGAATVPALTLTCLMAVILEVCILINKLNAVYVVAIVSELTRSFLVATNLNFILITFRGYNYGTIFGISFLLGGLLNLLQFPLFIWAESSNSYLGISIVLLVCAGVSFCHPIYMTIYRMRGASKNKE